MSHRIIPRAEWGAKFRAGFGSRPVGNLDKWLHHSVTQAPDLLPPFTDDFAAVRNLEAIGNSRFKGGISYTFAITPVGLIFEGTGVSRVGAHTAGRNTGSVGIVLVGNYDIASPPKPMLDAVAWLLQEGVRQGWWKTAKLTGGHRDVKGTACPGRYAYGQIGAINGLAAGVVAGGPPAPGASSPSGNRVLEYGMQGPDVKKVQAFLGMPEAERDGILGPNTRKWIKAYQKSVGLDDDGVVGKLTWAKIDAGVKSPAPAPSKPAPAPAPVKPSFERLDVDGTLGSRTITRWQQVMGTPVDGKISPNSQLVIAVQKHLVARGHSVGKAGIDGDLGPSTIRALQSYLGTPVDGKISPNSQMVRALQARLNANTF